MKTRYVLMLLIMTLLLLSGCSMKAKEKAPAGKDDSKNSAFHLDAESIKDLDSGVLRGTPLKLDKDLKLSEIEKVWGKPTEHLDLEEYQRYRYTIKDQSFYIFEDEMNEITKIEAELDYSKSEILRLMGEPAISGHIFIYEKEKHVVQFEKYDKWRLILRTK